MNIIYETTKERGATILIPTDGGRMNPAWPWHWPGNKPHRKKRTGQQRSRSINARSKPQQMASDDRVAIG